MIAGVTGTQRGMTTLQAERLYHFMVHLMESADPIEEWHHGDCIGTDSQSHDYALAVKVPSIHVHPGLTLSKRAFCANRSPKGSCVVYEPIDNLERNVVIARKVDRLFVCPKEFNEIIRSGTWHCWRRAARRAETEDSKVIVILPDGVVSPYYSRE